MFRKYLVKSAILSLLLSTPLTSFSEGVIKVGMSTALEGPASGLGSNVKLGVEAYFDQVNKNGGIAGRKLKLTALNDGYEPQQAGANMRKLIEEEKVVAVIGNVGTPTAVVTVPIAIKLPTVVIKGIR